jgi:hypothetical protein
LTTFIAVCSQGFGGQPVVGRTVGCRHNRRCLPDAQGGADFLFSPVINKTDSSASVAVDFLRAVQHKDDDASSAGSTGRTR